jgi:hypothetical protein
MEVVAEMLVTIPITMAQGRLLPRALIMVVRDQAPPVPVVLVVAGLVILVMVEQQVELPRVRVELAQQER